MVVVGMGGAGKSVLARRLGAAWDLPVVHLDAVFWGPGWRPTPPEVWRGVVEGLAGGDRWVIEGDYPEVLDLILARAQLAVFLDIPRWVTLPRLLARPLRRRDRGRGDLPRGLRHVADRENLGWAWHWPQRHRPSIEDALIDFAAAGGEVAALTSTADVRRWLRAPWSGSGGRS